MRAPDQRHLGGAGWWMLGAILIGIWQSQPEISTAIAQRGIDYSIYLGPIWIKLVKDAFTVVLWLYLVTMVKDPFPPSVRRCVAWLYAITIAAFAIACVQASPLMAAAGLRWVLAVFVMLELRRLHGREVDGALLAKILIALMAAHLALQFARLFYFPPIWGQRWGLAGRAPGFFLLPNTNALFVVAAAAIVIDIVGRGHAMARSAMLVALVSAGLSQSGGGLAACAVLLAFLYLRNAWVALPVLAVCAVLFLTISPVLLGRSDFLSASGGERLDKLEIAATELAGIGAFGAYTNTGFMLAISDSLTGNSTKEPIISDSFYVSLIGNFGILSIPLAFLCWRALRAGSRHLRRRELQLGTASLLCLGTFAFSTIVSEAFPMTIMLGIGIWLGSRHRRRRRRKVRPTASLAPALSNGRSMPDLVPQAGDAPA